MNEYETTTGSLGYKFDCFFAAKKKSAAKFPSGSRYHNWHLIIPHLWQANQILRRMKYTTQLVHKKCVCDFSIERKDKEYKYKWQTD